MIYPTMRTQCSSSASAKALLAVAASVLALLLASCDLAETPLVRTTTLLNPPISVLYKMSTERAVDIMRLQIEESAKALTYYYEVFDKKDWETAGGGYKFVSAHQSGFVVQYTGLGDYKAVGHYSQYPKEYTLYRYQFKSTQITVSFADVKAIKRQMGDHPFEHKRLPRYVLYNGNNERLWVFFPTIKEEYELLAALFVLCPNVQ
jgi:hypothetical protein